MPRSTVRTITVKIKYSGALEFKKLFLNKIERRFRNNVATARVEPNTSISMVWHALGVPGAKWQYTVEAQKGYDIDPAKLKKPQKKTLKQPYEKLPAEKFKVVVKS